MVAFNGCDKQTTQRNELAAKPEANAVAKFHAPQDESQFIVTTILQDVAEQLFYAKERRLPNSNQLAITIFESASSIRGRPDYELNCQFPGLPGVHIPLHVDGPIWSPAIYQESIAALSKTLELNPETNSTADDLQLLRTLTDMSAVTMEKENQRVSAALRQGIQDPLLHEESALLLATLAIRDHAGEFFDNRWLLCRVTAHLALARQFSASRQLGKNGLVAEAALFVLMNNQTNALSLLQAFSKDDEDVVRWTRSLRALCTSDYRELGAVKDPTPLERISHFLAFARVVNLDVAWANLSKKEQQIVDMVRIAMTEGYCVETGHELLALALPLELQEIASVYELRHQRQLKAVELCSALNALPYRSFDENGVPCVISWTHSSRNCDCTHLFACSNMRSALPRLVSMKGAQTPQPHTPNSFRRFAGTTSGQAIPIFTVRCKTLTLGFGTHSPPGRHMIHLFEWQYPISIYQ